MAISYRRVAYAPLSWIPARTHDGVMRTIIRNLRNLFSDFVYGIDAGHAIRHGLEPRRQPPREG